MAILKAFARPMLASIFIFEGYRTLRCPESVAKEADPVVRSLAGVADFMPDDTEQAVRINGAVQLAAGTLLALGWAPRLAAAAIAASLVPTTAAGHRFWEEEDPEERGRQRVHFLKNLALAGGLLIAAGDTAGRPSLAWQTRHGTKAVRRQLVTAARVAKVSGKVGAKAGRVSTKLPTR